jgi:hypothetical protein
MMMICRSSSWIALNHRLIVILYRFITIRGYANDRLNVGTEIVIVTLDLFGEILPRRPCAADSDLALPYCSRCSSGTGWCNIHSEFLSRAEQSTLSKLI